LKHLTKPSIVSKNCSSRIDQLDRGLDYVDRERAKRQAVQQAHQIAHEQYGAGNSGWDQLQNGGGRFGGGFQGQPFGGNYAQQNTQSYSGSQGDPQNGLGDQQDYDGQLNGYGQYGEGHRHHHHHHRQEQEQDC